MDVVERMLEKRRWYNRCLRTNIVKPEDVEICKNTRFVRVESNCPQRRYKYDRELMAAIEAIAPEWWGDDETRINLNRNVQCVRHKDANKEHSYILWLGDFTGGALLFDDGTRLEEKCKWHKINGQAHRWNEPHEGTKYGIVLYRSRGAKSKAELIHKRIRQQKGVPETGTMDLVAS